MADTGSTGTTGGVGAGAQFNDPRGIDIDSSGSLYIADTFNNLIRKIDALQIYINTDTYSSPSGLLTLTSASTYRNRQRHQGHHYSGIIEGGRNIALPN